MEWELQQHGFDFCYDKRLYDRLEHESAESVRLHLCADLEYQQKLLRFLENHDEPRAASAFPGAKEKAAAVDDLDASGRTDVSRRAVRRPQGTAAGVPGRRPDEPVDKDLQAFYRRLLKAIDRPVFRDGEWSLCERSGWPDNSSYLNLVAWRWAQDGERYLIVVNLSDSKADAQIDVPWTEGAGRTWVLERSAFGRGLRTQRQRDDVARIVCGAGSLGVQRVSVQGEVNGDVADAAWWLRRTAKLHLRGSEQQSPTPAGKSPLAQDDTLKRTCDGRPILRS